MPRFSPLRAGALCLALVSVLGSAGLRSAQAGDSAPKKRHALSLIGDPKLPPDYPHVDWVNPDAPKGGAIRLTIDQQISNILPGAADLINSVDEVTSIRSIKTNVIVDDGSILVLGGLIDDVVRESESRIPLLGDIPLLGRIFSYEATSMTDNQIVIFITPHILSG